MYKIYYHGSNEKFTAFDKSKIKENKLGLCFNFTDDYSIAYQYGDNIVKVHLDLNNPLTLDIWDNIFPFEYYNKFGKLLLDEPDYEYDKQEYEKSPYTFGEMFNIYKMYPEFIQILEEMGYDSIAIPEDHHFGVFEPEQIHIIQNEDLNDNFWKWFGNSKTVDKDGNPLVFYHGTRQTFNKFKAKYDDGLLFFAYDEEFAKDWAKGSPLTIEQQELQNDLYDKSKPFNNAVVKKMKQKYNTDDLSSDELYKELKTRTNRYYNRLEKQAGIEPKVMRVYIKAENIFVPERDYELVLDEIISYYEWKNPYTKEYEDKLKEFENAYDVAQAHWDEWWANNKDADEETIQDEEKKLDMAFRKYSRYKSIKNEFDNHIKRIKTGAWVYFEHKNVIDKIWKLGYDAIQLSEKQGIITTLAIREGTNQVKSVDNNGNWSDSANIYEQLAYHGSNSTFDKFNSDKIKEYRYGWGFYFTRSQSYAKDYGNVKQYEIPDDEYLLDWESSYNYQPETVQNALYEIWQEVKSKDTELLFEKAIFGDYCNNGYWIYYTLSEVLHLSAKETSLLLYKHGIKGIYSLEGNCIVIFNPKDIRLNETYSSKGINMNFKRLNEEIEKFLKTIEEQNDQELTVPNKPKLRSMADDIVDLASETVKSVGHALTGDIFRKRKSSVNNLGSELP